MSSSETVHASTPQHQRVVYYDILDGEFFAGIQIDEAEGSLDCANMDEHTRRDLIALIVTLALVILVLLLLVLL